MNGPGYIDAKFKMISPPQRGWRLSFDWRNFLVVAVIVVGTALRSQLLGH